MTRVILSEDRLESFDKFRYLYPNYRRWVLQVKSRQSTYGLVIPYYKLVTFKVDANHYTLTYNEYFLKIRVEYSSDHKFLKRVLEEKAQFLNQNIS